MQYQESRIKLVSLKTRNAKRTIQMCDKLKVYFQELARRREHDQLHLADLREQNQRIIEDLIYPTKDRKSEQLSLFGEPQDILNSKEMRHLLQ